MSILSIVKTDTPEKKKCPVELAVASLALEVEEIKQAIRDRAKRRAGAK